MQIDLGWLIVVIAVLSFVWWLLTTEVPLHPVAKMGLSLFIGVVICLLLLNAVGLTRISVR